MPSRRAKTRTNARLPALAAGVVATLAGVTALTRWLVGTAALGSMLPGTASMRPSTALTFVLAGASVCLAGSGASVMSRGARRVMEACAGAAALMGFLTLLDYASGWDLGIDQLLPGGSRVRMAPATALNFVLVGIALLWEADGRRDPRPAQALALAATLVALLAVIGYAYETQAISGAPPRMALPTGLAFCVLCAGILLLRADQGFIAVVGSDSAGGVMARRVLPVAIAAPVVLGWLRLAGQHAGFYGTERGLAMFAVCNIALLVAVVAWTAGSLYRADRDRRRVEEALTASERRARQLTEASLDGIVVADDEGRIILFNPAAERTFGYTAAEVLGEPLTCLMPPEFHEPHRAGLRRFVETRVARLVGRTVEVAGRRKDGARFPLELSLGALEVGGRVQFIGTIRDVSERDRMHAAMIQSEKLASIGLLTAGVAHEINNPLAYVANNLAVLERDTRGVMAVLDAYEGARERLAAADPATAARVRKLAEEIDLPYVRGNLDRLLGRTREGVERVTRLVQAMRGMARSGPPQMETIGLADLVDMSLEMIRSRLQRRGITVECDCTGVPKLRCATSQVSQVLLNLLVNALQAIEAAGRPEGGRIRIASRAVGREILIEVADNGCGIAPQDLPHVFDPFFTTKAVGDGTGLGLSITHGIVAGHGGRLEVSSEPGKGSCFRVFLPLSSGGAS